MDGEAAWGWVGRSTQDAPNEEPYPGSEPYPSSFSKILNAVVSKTPKLGPVPFSPYTSDAASSQHNSNSLRRHLRAFIGFCNIHIHHMGQPVFPWAARVLFPGKVRDTRVQGLLPIAVCGTRCSKKAWSSVFSPKLCRGRLLGWVSQEQKIPLWVSSLEKYLEKEHPARSPVSRLLSRVTNSLHHTHDGQEYHE